MPRSITKAAKDVLKEPHGVALAYFFFGISWVLVTDFLVFRVAPDSQTVTYLQTAKGWIFVGGSTVLLYAIVWYSHRSLDRTNQRLERSIKQASILHRLLRHNLRNTCNVIQGNVELLEAEDSGAEREELREIKRQTERLAEISTKTNHLRNLVFESPAAPYSIDLARAIEDVVETMRARYPDLELQTELPAEMPSETTPHVKRALVELIENAIEHHDGPDPTVTVGARSTGEDGVELFVADEGPGMPEMEREVLNEGVERPMFHSQGLGLWIAYTIVEHAGGRFRILDNDPRGTVINIELP